MASELRRHFYIPINSMIYTISGTLSLSIRLTDAKLSEIKCTPTTVSVH